MHLILDKPTRQLQVIMQQAQAHASSSPINPFLRDDGVIASILGACSTAGAQIPGCQPAFAAPQLTLQDMLMAPSSRGRASQASSVYSSRWSDHSSLESESVFYLASPAPPVPPKSILHSPPRAPQAVVSNKSGKLQRLVVCRNFLQRQRQRVAQHRAVQSLLVKLAGRDCRNDPHWADVSDAWESETVTEKQSLTRDSSDTAVTGEKRRYGYF